MKTIRYIAALLLAVTGLCSCSKDGDTISVLSGDDIVLLCSGDAVLNKENTGALALTLNWNDNSRLTTSDPAVQAPIGAVTNTLQFSLSDAFDATVDELVPSGTSRQFTAKQLNTIASKLGLTDPDVATPVYVRLRAAVGSNVTPRYSNTCSVMVTPYFLDMTIASPVDVDGVTGADVILYSPSANGIYSGFLGANGWGHWWLQESDGTTWGNLGEDGKEFYMSKKEDGAWNFWFPGQTGCYYVVADTKAQTYTAMLIPSLSVSGDIEGDMTYDRKTNTWALTFTANATGSATISISGQGKLYDISTRCNDDEAKPQDVGFGQDGDHLTFGSEASDITVNIPATGEVTLTLDLNDMRNLTATVAEGGGSQEEEVSKILYVLGNDDTWNYDQWLSLIDEDNKTYAAAVNFNCSWGYYFSAEYQDWNNINQDPEDPGMKLKVTGSNDYNLSAPGTGLYVVAASLGWMSYWYPMSDESGVYAIQSVQCTGFNDNWDAIDMTAVDGQPGVFQAEVAATGDTPWGVQVLMNGSWEWYFGTQLDGTLTWGKKENGAPQGWEVGNIYTFTVDLCHGTYSLNIAR